MRFNIVLLVSGLAALASAVPLESREAAPAPAPVVGRDVVGLIDGLVEDTKNAINGGGDVTQILKDAFANLGQVLGTT